MAHLSDSSCPAMDEAEKKLLAAATHVYIETIVLGLIPLAYGICTFIFGDELWLGRLGTAIKTIPGEYGVYETAYQVPFAPESWGTVFVLFGLTTLVSALKGWGKLVMASTMASGFIFLFFALSFVTDAFSNHSAPAWPPSIIYVGLAVLCVNRAKLAFVWDT